MEFDRIYFMYPIGRRTALHVNMRDKITQEDASALLLGKLMPDKPLIFNFMKGASGSTANDFVGTSMPPLDLISDRVVEVLQPFKGWTTYPVEVYGKKGELIPGYHGLAITGRCGPIDDTKSKETILPPHGPGLRHRRQWIGLYFNPSTWDGSDLFLPEGRGNLFTIEAVKAAMQRAKITNVQFEPLPEVENISALMAHLHSERQK